MNVVNINPEKEPVPRSWNPVVITGGKEPPDPPLYETWLSKMDIGTVFVAKHRNETYGKVFEVLFKGEIFILLDEYSEEDTIARYVIPVLFCRFHPDYEVLGVNNLPEEGEDNEQRNRSD